jgi:hypothetical protein
MTEHPPTTVIVPASDPVIDRVGFPLTHRYVEACWLPVLGPTSLALLRYVGHQFDEAVHGTRGFAMPTLELARQLGVGRVGGRTPLGHQHPLHKSLVRLAGFGIGQWLADDWPTARYSVHTHLAPLASSHLRHLPPPTLALHHLLVDERVAALADEVAAAHP